jgi:hypothetical protein
MVGEAIEVLDDPETNFTDIINLFFDKSQPFGTKHVSKKQPQDENRPGDTQG